VNRPRRWLPGLLLAVSPALAADEPPGRVRVRVEPNLAALLTEEDTDADQLITVADRGDRRFELRDTNGKSHLVEGTYPLANLLEEFGVALRSGRRVTVIDITDIRAAPPRRISRMIRRHYWDWLTRRMDSAGLRLALQDPKMDANGRQRLYVPNNDPLARSYYRRIAEEFPCLGLEVIELPRQITPEFVRTLDDKPGLLSLALRRDASGEIEPAPFVTPGGRFNEMYGWDSYFIALGLLADDRVDLAKALVDNHVYQIEHYGQILNANRTYYLSRSQPPFLTSMALAVFDRLPRTPQTRDWLAGVLRAAIREYETVWTQGTRLTPTGLSRYFDSASGMPPEVTPDQYAHVLRPYAARHGLDIATFATRYRAGQIQAPELDTYFVHDRAMRESGHDTTYRLVGRAANLNPVALNALLYKYETDIAQIIRSEFGDDFALSPERHTNSDEWMQRARDRRQRMLALMWNEERGLFFDYDFVKGRQLEYVSATTLYPLWAGLVDEDRARRLIHSALSELEAPGGILSSTKASRGPVSAERPPRQWDYPFGWAPHQMLAWEGLRRYGLQEDAERLAYRWLYMLALNTERYNGAITEKYDVVRRTFDADVEYGNVGVRFQYVSDGGFGWTNASFQVGRRLLNPARRQDLDRMIPPEWLFKPTSQSEGGHPARLK
jgi:alpha,alpha-trehalase